MKRNELFNNQFNEVVKLKDVLNFDELLVNLRKAYGITRQRASEETGIPYQKIVLLELGHFYNVPPKDILDKLADYYDIDPKIMKKKAIDFIEQGKPKEPYLSRQFRGIRERAMKRAQA